MASLAFTSRRGLETDNNSHQPIIKKRTANSKLSTRQALGDLKSNIESNAARKPRQTALRKELVKKESKLPVLKREKVKNVLDSPTPMEVEAPVEIPLAKLPSNVEDIDREDIGNPQLCPEFVSDIYKYMLHLEAKFPIKKHYMDGTSLKPKMRSILVDWLFQVQHRFQLLQETVYLTVALLDRFLQIENVQRSKLQLVGVTSMLLASKYEEMYAPEVTDFVYITDKAFTSSEILAMEIVMLEKLDFNFGRPLPINFLRRNSKAGQVDAAQHALAKYLLELSLLDYEMCHLPPSILAAGALCLSIKVLEDQEWSDTLHHYSTYSSKELLPIVCHLAKNLVQAPTNQYVKFIRNKYSSQKSMKVALLPELNSEVVKQLAALSSSHIL